MKRSSTCQWCRIKLDINRSAPLWSLLELRSGLISIETACLTLPPERSCGKGGRWIPNIFLRSRDRYLLMEIFYKSRSFSFCSPYIRVRQAQNKKTYGYKTTRLCYSTPINLQVQTTSLFFCSLISTTTGKLWLNYRLQGILDFHTYPTTSPSHNLCWITSMR